jgi:hypothetical protein
MNLQQLATHSKQIQAIKVGIAFKDLEANECTEAARTAYQNFNKLVNGMSDEEKEHDQQRDQKNPVTKNLEFLTVSGGWRPL